MNSIISLAMGLLLFITTTGCIIQNPQPQDCVQLEIVVESIYKGSAADIVLTQSDGDFYYINRGLEQGLDIDQLRDKLLNKKVNLHLAKTRMGTSAHIAQIAINRTVIYSEFD